MIRKAVRLFQPWFHRPATSAAAVPPEPVVCVVESDSVIVGENETRTLVTVEGLGIETQGGVFTRLIPFGTAVPCSVTETFATAVDRQTELYLRLYRGNHDTVRRNHYLGSYLITGIAPARAGASQVEVTFRISEQRQIVVSAQESRKPLTIRRAEDGP